LVRLHGTVQKARLVLLLAPRGIECVADRHVGILVPPICGRLARDVDVPAGRQGEMDAYAVGVALVTAMLRRRRRAPR
jgi:hypothetical protein